MKTVYKMSLIAKGATQKFHEDFEPGVLATQEVTLSDTLSDLDQTLSLIEAERNFRKEMIEIRIEKLSNNLGENNEDN